MENETTTRRRLLMIVTGVPRTSGRMAEAVRFTAGVSAWQKVDVTLYVGGDAVQGFLVGENRFVDEDSIVDFLPLITEHKQDIFVEHGHPVVAGNRCEIPYPELDAQGLSKLAVDQDFIVRF
jgi:hypothetical protein